MAVLAAVGVPEMTPVLAFSDNPVGNVPDDTDQVYGAVPPVADKVVLYAIPMVPLGIEVVVIVRVDEGVTELDADDAALVPIALVAVTVNVYAVPFDSPVTLIGLDDPVPVMLAGID